MKISSEKMLKFLSTRDERKYYHFCHDISLAGDNYKIWDIAFFNDDDSAPSEAFVCLKRYDDGMDSLYVNTSDDKLVKEALAYRDTSTARFNSNENEKNKLSLSTKIKDVLDMPVFTDRFILNEPEDMNSPYYILSNSSVPVYNKFSEGIEIFLLTDENEETVSAELCENDKKHGVFEYSDKHIGSWTLGSDGSVFKDTRIYFLRSTEEIIGYLRAECGYKNYYEIGWLQINEKERGKGYASLLVSYFTEDCLRNGWIPDYSYAISPESKKVAKRCGFIKEEGYSYRRNLIEK